MDSMRVAKEYYSRMGSSLSEQVDEMQTQSEVAYLLKHITADDVVLDVGCGYGRVAKALQSYSLSVCGCDVSEEMISAVNDERFIVASMCDLPYADNEFTVGICIWSAFNSLLTRSEQLQALKELLRVCSDKVLIDLPDGDDFAHVWQRKTKGQGVDGHIVENYFMGPKNIIYVHTRKTMISLCEELGCSFTVERSEFGTRRRLLVWLTHERSL